MLLKDKRSVAMVVEVGSTSLVRALLVETAEMHQAKRQLQARAELEARVSSLLEQTAQSDL